MECKCESLQRDVTLLRSQVFALEKLVKKRLQLNRKGKTREDRAFRKLQRAVETGKKMRALRLSKKWSQQKLAEVLGVTHAMVSMMESGERDGTSMMRSLRAHLRPRENDEQGRAVFAAQSI